MVGPAALARQLRALPMIGGHRYVICNRCYRFNSRVIRLGEATVNAFRRR